MLGERDAERLTGIRSWRCCRETEIWRAMEMSAAYLRRSWWSRSSVSVLLRLRVGRGSCDCGCGWVVMGAGAPKVAFETSSAFILGFGISSAFTLGLETSSTFILGMAVVVALRFRRAGGGWILTCFWEPETEATLLAAVEFEREEPDEEGVDVEEIRVCKG